MSGFYRRSSYAMLALTALFLLLSHTVFFPSPPERPVIRQRRRSGLLLQQDSMAPEPLRQGAHTSAPPSAAAEAVAVAVAPHDQPLGLMGGASALGAEAAAPYRAHGEEDTRCEPRRERTLPSRALDMVVPNSSTEWPINCGGDNEALCGAVRAAAVDRQVLVGVANSAVKGQLDKWIESNRRAGISNMLIVAIDEELPAWLASKGVACWARPDKALGSHMISAQKFKFVKSFLSVGASVLMSDIDVVYLRNPFRFLWGDADIEGTTDGWDDGSAYGWMEQLDDPSLGPVGRFRPAMRITAWNSGLWYASATHASLRLMTILAYRMEHEPKTWDQAAFGEEVARPARDGHHAAGIVKRALNYWCFANSKTVFRRMRVEPQVSGHSPVVVHANYHQPKQPRMDAVYNRWHLGQTDALDTFNSEPTSVLPAPALEKNFLHQINDGFVSGGDTRTALQALRQGCGPLPSIHSVGVTLHLLPRTECEPQDTLCQACRRVARKSPSGVEEVMLVLAVAAEAEPLRLLLSSAKRAGVTSLVIAAADPALGTALGDTEGVPVVDVSGQLSGGASPAAVAELRWQLVGRLLNRGLGLLSSSAATLLVSDPFLSLYRDADIEAMSLGWDDPSAYGYNHVIDDPSMGFTRFCHGSRIVGYEPNLFYASPTIEAVSVARRMGDRMREAGGGAPIPEGGALGTRGGGPAPEVALRIAAVERESLTRELWLPSRNEYSHSGAILRVMNYLCFANSKVLTRQQQQAFASHKPVLVSIDYHADAAVRMAAAAAAFVEGDSAALRALPASDTTGAARAPCEPGGRVWRDSDAETPEAAEAMDKSPWAWGGVPGFIFRLGGELATPWGSGTWGVHAGVAGALFADFIGTSHNVELSHGVAVATRCRDQNIVLMRSVKGIEFPK